LTALLVATKFAPPRIGSRAVAREHLMARLHEARQRRLVLVVGSAGFGKTTLIAQWRQDLIKSGATVAWLSLAHDDAAPTQFCAHVIGALQQAGVALEDDLLLLSETDTAAGLHAVSSALINSLARTPRELYLMIDDFHYVNDPATLQLVQKLLDAAPANLHIVIASRTAPALLLGRLRARGELDEIEFGELSFDFRESLTFLKAHLDAGIDIDAAHYIHDLTDGWPIGLQLVSISLKANPGKRRRLTSLRPNSQDLSAYLSEDVIADLPADLLDFMQKVSILRRFNAEVAAQVTGFAQAAELIATLEARNLFILPVDLQHEEAWYRFHPMFAEFLSMRLAHAATDVPQLHGRAARWFKQKGLLAEAVRHAFLSEDLDSVVQLLEGSLSPLTSVSHLSAFLRWIDRVPQQLLSQHPRLLMMAGWACALSARPARADSWIAVLDATRPGSGFSDEIQLLKAMIASQRDDAACVLQIVQSLGDIPLGHRALEDMRTSLTIATLAVAGHHAEARNVFNSPPARRSLSSTDEPALMIQFATTIALRTAGNVVEAERIGAPALAKAEAVHGRRSVGACSGAAVMAEVLYELDRVDDARETLATRLGMLRFSTPESMFYAAVIYGRLQLLQEGPRAALEYQLDEETYFRSLGMDRGVTLMLAERLHVVIRTGDWRHGATLLAELESLAQRHQGSHSLDVEIAMIVAVSRARFALGTEEPGGALQPLEDLRRIATRLGRGIALVLCDLLKAQALDDLGHADESLECLQSAVASGYRLGLVRTFLDEGERLRNLLLKLEYPASNVLAEYLRRVTVQHERPAPQDRAPAPAPGGGQSPAVDLRGDSLSLTRRELEVLSLLEKSMSNKRIALALNISIQTVKWNLKKIFAKLGVSSRYEAIVAARKSNLGARADEASRRT
jgi:LuxR family transcriptional regulator, maltose regulon positive regulatory protein